jgi:hypothetical protein
MLSEGRKQGLQWPAVFETYIYPALIGASRSNGGHQSHQETHKDTRQHQNAQFQQRDSPVMDRNASRLGFCVREGSGPRNSVVIPLC